MLKYLSVAIAGIFPLHANAEAQEENCSSLPLGAEFAEALSANPYNLFTDPNHEDLSFNTFFTTPAVVDCLNQASISHLFLEFNKDSDSLFERLRNNEIGEDQFIKSYFDNTLPDSPSEIDKVRSLARLVMMLSDAGIEAVAADDLSQSNLALIASGSRNRAFQLWSTLIPEEERQDFLDWTTRGRIVDEEIKRRHIEYIANQQDSDAFINGQRLFANADELDEMGAIEERLDDRPFFEHVSGLIEQDNIERFAIIRGEGHFSESPYAINNLFDPNNTTVFCLRSEFTQQPVPDACDYIVNVTTYNFSRTP